MSGTNRKCLPPMIVLILASAVGNSRAQLPEPRSIADLERELATMSKVLVESINRSSLEDWHRVTGGASPFNSKISTMYLPGVGALFTIPVNFPLIDHQKVEATAPESEEDLWSKHSETRILRRRESTRPPTAGPR